MDPQLRRGILDACVLAVLEKGESYGYKLVKDISEFIPITESTLYPILKRLEMQRMVSVFSEEHNGRLRKYYKITPDGSNRISELMNEWSEIIKLYQYIEKERNSTND